MLNRFNKLTRNFENSLWLNPFTGVDSFFSQTEISYPKSEDPNYEFTQETVESDATVTTKETWKSTDGTSTFSRVVTKPKVKVETEDDIKNQIKLAVDSEDYELAAKLKRKIVKK
jgi:hypothetical protein